jgi:hypothetical protein
MPVKHFMMMPCGEIKEPAAATLDDPPAAGTT